jgi:hypothetical protein
MQITMNLILNGLISLKREFLIFCLNGLISLEDFDFSGGFFRWFKTQKWIAMRIAKFLLHLPVLSACFMHTRLF